jgi:4-amino-4-deoxy-L-arabinose transferase-like glycosyltransferase
MGPVDLVMPVLVIAIYLLAMRDLKHLKKLKLGWGILIVLAISLPYYLVMSLKGNYAFGLLERACQPDLVLGGTYEILARAIHEDYIRKQREIGIATQTNSSMVPWDELPEYLKESNRRQADNIGARLKAVGCYLEPLADWDAALFKFTAEEV